MKVTMKTLRGLEGLTAITEANGYNGIKGKWEYMYALEHLLTMLRGHSADYVRIVSQYHGNGWFIRNVHFRAGAVWWYCKIHMLNTDESIEDLIQYLRTELERED